MQQHQRDDLLKKFKKSAFPKEKIASDCLHHSEVIFNAESCDLQIKPNQKTINKEFFFFENEEKRPKFQKEFPTENNAMNWRTQKAAEPQQSRPKDPKQQQRPYKGKVKGNESSQYNTEPSTGSEIQKQTNEDPFQVNYDSNTNSKQNNSIITGQMQGNVMPTNVPFNQNPMLNFIQQQQNALFQQFIQPNLLLQNDPYFDPNFDIKVLEKFNKKLQFPENLPLWYLFHPMIKSSFGPLTTLQVENMFNSKQIFSNSMIRFIDIYERKDSDQFNFFPIKELENENLLNEIIPSKVLKYLYVENLNNLPQSNVNVQSNQNNQMQSQPIQVQNTNPQNELTENPVQTSNTTVKKDDDWDEVLQDNTQTTNTNTNNNNKKGKKKKHRPNYEDYNPVKHNKNYTPSISSYNTNPTTNTLGTHVVDDSENWEQVVKNKKPEKTGNKIVGTGANKSNNSVGNYSSNNYNYNYGSNSTPVYNNQQQNNNKRPSEVKNDNKQLLEALNPSKKKLDPSIEIIETEFVGQNNYNNNNNNNQNAAKKPKKQKVKFTDLNVQIGAGDVAGDIYKVESKKKK